MSKTMTLAILVLSLAAWSLAAEPSTAPPAAGLKLDGLKNPILATADNLRDPAILKTKDGYTLFYSRLSSKAWGSAQSWAIASTTTRDFVRFDDDHDISPKGFASPGDPITWHGRLILPYQSYPIAPARLCYSESADGRTWSAPRFFLDDAAKLPWNTHKRLIDPTFIIDGDTLHCYFIGSASHKTAAGKTVRANLMGHAITTDPKLEKWEILSTDAPMIGISQRAPDGVENLAIIRTGQQWTMIYSEGLEKQHLAIATSKDLRTWNLEGPIELATQKWMSRKFGAPFIWREPDQWVMILMGTDATDRTTFGLLTSQDGRKWTLLPERQ